MVHLIFVIGLLIPQLNPFYSIEVAPPLVAHWANPITMRMLCGTNHSVYGFTMFDQELQCHCRGVAGQRWHVVSSAVLRPRMYLTKPGYAAHERLHVEDIRRRLARHLASIAQIDFASETDCTKAATQEMRAFPQWMAKAIRESNDDLH